MKSISDLTNEELAGNALCQETKYDHSQIMAECTRRFLHYVAHEDLPLYDRGQDLPHPDDDVWDGLRKKASKEAPSHHKSL